MTATLERVGCQTPTLARYPADQSDTTLGDIAVGWAYDIGYRLHPWQDVAVRRILTRMDQWVTWQPRVGEAKQVKMWSARDVVIEMPRQNGKNVVLEVVELALVFLFDFRLIVHSAHRADTVHEHYLRLEEVIKNNPDLMDAMPTHKMNDGFTTANGKESIQLANGARILFKTRSTGGKVGKGPSPEVVVFDEAFDLKEDAMGALAPSTSAQPNPLLIFTSSAPRKHSHVLHGFRKRAATGNPADNRLLALIWGSDPEVDPDDIANWYLCNPSLGLTKYESNITADRVMFESLPNGLVEFLAEHLGIGEDEEADELVLQLEAWDALLDMDSTIATKPSIALMVSHDRAWGAFGLAGRRKDNLFHVEVAERRPGTGWMVNRAAELADKWDIDIGINTATNSPARSLLPELVEAKVPIVEYGSGDFAAGWGMFLDAVRESRLVHLESRSLRAGIKGAVQNESSDAPTLSLRRSRGEVSSLAAVALALVGVPQLPKKKLKPQVLAR